eukprot:TRINITY_DN15379_c0_g1_i1.p1 TRINITY_DN15379_c0_g1~~TRINITY_DN15379_c0_g1_i1.p1  ORF type:complete len:442 (+),score=137.16 TRINITY_DN15379_c0_g1_i1:67-1392(+)
MQATDDQTLLTLRGLKQSGALRAKDATGEPLELDPKVASDLLNADKVQYPLNGTSVLNNNQLSMKRRHSPLPVLRKDTGEQKALRSNSIDLYATDELVKKLARECEAFNQNLVTNFNTARVNIQKDLLELFKTTAKEKLPDSFLRSLPKWGKGATKLHQVFNKTMHKKKTDSTMDQKEVPFDLVIQPEIVEEVDKDIQHVLDNELELCIGENGVIINDMQRIIVKVTVVMERLRVLEERLEREEAECRLLQERNHDEIALNKELSDKVDMLLSEAKDKEAQMDILREQIRREREQARNKRTDYYKEICRYKSHIERYKQFETSGHDYDRGLQKSPRRRESGEKDTADIGYALGPDQGEVQQLIEQREKELKAEFQEQLKALKAQHLEQVKQIQQQKKIACDERDEQNAQLLKRIKKLEFELVEEKRKMRRFLSSIEKDQTD